MLSIADLKNQLHDIIGELEVEQLHHSRIKDNLKNLYGSMETAER
jgi:hypothetical protein